MGLDMYLYRTTSVTSSFNDDKPTEIKNFKWLNYDIPFEPKKISEIKENAMYWRKSNAIHRWFVKNVQEGIDDCQEHPVSYEQLQTLVDLCKQVIKNNEPNLLPPMEGFFFGSDDIDDYYYTDLQNTIDELTQIIETSELVMATSDSSNMNEFKVKEITQMYYRADW